MTLIMWVGGGVQTAISSETNDLSCQLGKCELVCEVEK